MSLGDFGYFYLRPNPIVQPTRNLGWDIRGQANFFRAELSARLAVRDFSSRMAQLIKGETYDTDIA